MRASLVQRRKKFFFRKSGFCVLSEGLLFQSQKVAQRMMIQEFAMYDSMLQYHKMFERDGVAGDIAQSTAAPERQRAISDRLKAFSKSAR